jgi:hypothetical protein
MEMTFVGMYADTSPACVSMMGSAVSEPPESGIFLATLVAARSLRGLLGLVLGLATHEDLTASARGLLVLVTDPLFGHLGGALEQAAVHVEHVARVRLAARRAAQEQRELAVGHGLLGEVVVDESACCRCRGSTRPSSRRCRAR